MVKFVELAGGFVEEFVVEGGDAPLFFLHLVGAVLVESLGGGADLVDEFGSGGWGEGEGFKTGCVGVGDIGF